MNRGVFTAACNGIEFELARDEDAIELLSRCDGDLAFIGEDKIRELELDESRTEVSIVGSVPIECRLVLAGARRKLRGTPTALGKGELLTVATSYPRSLERFAKREKLNLRVTYSPVGGCEAYAATGRSDLVFDIVQTGKTLEAQDLVVYRKDKELSLFVIDAIKRTPTPQAKFQADLAAIERVLFNRIRQARSEPDATSYTMELLRDSNKLTKKFGEEMAEFMQAMYRGPVDTSELTLEAADVLYVLQLVLAKNGIGITDVLAEDIRRNQTSGNQSNE